MGARARDCGRAPASTTEGATFPFWSADSLHIGFFADSKLKRIPLAGGSARIVADAPNARGGAWSDADVIVFAPGSNTPLYSVAAAGGPSTPLTRLEAADRDLAPMAVVSPWRKAAALLLRKRAAGIYRFRGHSHDTRRLTGRLGSKATARRRLRRTVSFSRLRGLRARHRARRATFSSPDVEPRRGYPHVGERPRHRKGRRRAALQHLRVGRCRRLPIARTIEFATKSPPVVRSRRHATRRVGAPDRFWSTWLYSDNKFVAAEVEDAETRTTNIWFYELATSRRTRFTFGQIYTSAVWAPDGASIVVATRGARQHFSLFRRASNGSSAEEPLIQAQGNVYAEDWSRDGRYLLYTLVDAAEKPGASIWVLPMQGERTARRLFQSAADDRYPISRRTAVGSRTDRTSLGTTKSTSPTSARREASGSSLPAAATCRFGERMDRSSISFRKTTS